MAFALPKTLSDEDKRDIFEKNLCKSTFFQEALKQFINLQDDSGKTALHYSAIQGHYILSQALIKNGACVFIRDNKGRKVIDVCRKEEIRCLIAKAEQEEFERRSKATVRSNETLESSLDRKEGFYKKRVAFAKENLSSYNNRQLASFIYGIYKDSALTYMMRIDDKRSFEYIMNRGISPLACDHNHRNVVHHAIQQEKIHFLGYLLGGDWDAAKPYENTAMHFQVEEPFTKEEASTLFTEKRWVERAWRALDKCTSDKGHTPLHLAILSSNAHIFNFIVAILVKRE